MRLRKLNPNGDFTNRTSGLFDLAGSPFDLTAGVERVVAFTIPDDATFGSGTYIVEVTAGDSGTGAYTMTLATP